MLIPIHFLKKIYLAALIFVINIAVIEPDHASNSLTKEQILNNFIKTEKLSRIKYELVDEVSSYINRVAPRAEVDGEVIVNACLTHDIDIKFVLAQAHIESHFGTSGRASKTNSIFNLAKTKYDHPNLSVEPYIILLKDKYLCGNKTEKHLMRNFVNYSGKRYAEDRMYERKLSSKYYQIKKQTQIDKLYNNYKTYTL